MQCFLCKKSNFKPIYGLKNKQIISCKNDGLVFADKIKIDNNKLYQKKYYSISPHPQSGNVKYFSKKLRLIKTLISPNSPISPKSPNTLNILDVGCGWGDFLKILKKHKIKHKGIDSSDEAISICRSKKLNVDRITLQALSEKEKNTYDAVTFFQVIEHLKDPLPILRAAKKILKKNGIILITTPNNDSPLRKFFRKNWTVYSENSHFVFYNQITLKQTLQAAGFEQIAVKNDSQRFMSLQYILRKISNSKFQISNFVSRIPIPTDPFGDLEAVATQTRN